MSCDDLDRRLNPNCGDVEQGIKAPRQGHFRWEASAGERSHPARLASERFVRAATLVWCGAFRPPWASAFLRVMIPAVRAPGPGPREVHSARLPAGAEASAWQRG